MDIAKTILDAHKDMEDGTPVSPSHKALAQHAYEVAPHEHALAEMLKPLHIPQEAKADLWEAKKNSVNDPRITRLLQISSIDPKVLDLAEAHPNVMKHLMEMDKPTKEGGGGAGGGKSSGGESKPGAAGAKSLGSIEIKAAEPKESKE